jgi:hypothetical protein
LTRTQYRSGNAAERALVPKKLNVVGGWCSSAEQQASDNECPHGSHVFAFLPIIASQELARLTAGPSLSPVS